MEALLIALLGLVFGALELRASASRTAAPTDERDRDVTAGTRRPMGSSPGAARETTLRKRAEAREVRNHERRLALLTDELAAAVGDPARIDRAERMLETEQARHLEKLGRLRGRTTRSRRL